MLFDLYSKGIPNRCLAIFPQFYHLWTDLGHSLKHFPLQKPFLSILLDKMKFLCLHGMGTNSSIFESQLSSTLPYLEAQGHEFIFVDGLIECAPAEGESCKKLILRVGFTRKLSSDYER